ncbi:hypothetical protein ACFFMR_14150 [Micromonospora andamanensis]|uniref:Uncharacterized protein n=1 Tax=Micromonospora andamanensis TaxID=1287068 RepID=A0ABQ4I2U4_9ACTN|nr:hypothetical protein [Micromonospora andamanensis]GIJ12200.1 hypothetical protein Van01_54140 [Micromonospora andamanensis]
MRAASPFTSVLLGLASTGGIGKAWLHLPTGSAGLIGIRPHTDGGPIADRSAPLLAADNLAAQPARPIGSRSTTDAEAALRAAGWHLVTRADAARRLLLAGYRLSRNRTAGHLLYADDADASIWRRCGSCLEAFAVTAPPRPDNGSRPQPLTHASEGTPR